MNVPFQGRLRQLPLVVLSVLVLAAGASASVSVPPADPPVGTGAKIKIENKSDKKRKLTQVVLVPKGQNEPAEIINLEVWIEPGKSYEIQSSQFEKASISSTTWDAGTGLGPMLILLESTQFFDIDTHDLALVTYTLMESAGAPISYAFTAQDLAASVPVPEGQSILVQNGRDRTGHFPASVVFLDKATQLPYTGSLVSMGEMEYRTVWQHGLFGGSSGLSGSAPRLDGSGDFTSNGTIQLVLSQAQPGGIAVLVAGLSEINVPFGGTTLGPTPRFVVPGLLVDENGGNVLSFTLGEVPAGLDLYAQEFVLEGSSLAATNTLHGMSW